MADDFISILNFFMTMGPGISLAPTFVIEPLSSYFCGAVFNISLIFSFSPLPSVRRRSKGTAHFSKIEFLFISRSACLLPTSWKPVPSTSIASTGCLSITALKVVCLIGCTGIDDLAPPVMKPERSHRVRLVFPLYDN